LLVKKNTRIKQQQQQLAGSERKRVRKFIFLRSPFAALVSVRHSISPLAIAQPFPPHRRGRRAPCGDVLDGNDHPCVHSLCCYFFYVLRFFRDSFVCVFVLVVMLLLLEKDAVGGGGAAAFSDWSMATKPQNEKN